jgi:Rrf2 family protein
MESAYSHGMRLEITRRADLAVRAMTALGAADGRLKSGELADALGTTTGMVPQVVGPLVKAGWVQSDPGPTGGYQLRVALEELSVLDVIETVDGPTENGRCVVEDRACDARNRCALHDAWSDARATLVASLDASTLADVAPRRPRRAR